ncbi:MAG TPA: flagellar biosynthesis protein FlhF [Caldimonas sp.]|jgi:flagellar biosynthesis protein FlhF|nr:flagellar biosynthesis protein FlhF [Caldimonas sp.]
MNVKRFTARNSREALRLVREALGDDAIVLSTKPAATGVEVMAMAPDSLGRLEAMAQEGATSPAQAAAARVAELASTSAEEDAERLSMSTLSFQDYVRKRMLKRRQASFDAAHAGPPIASAAAAAAPAATSMIGTRIDMRLDDDEPFGSDVAAPRAEPVAAAPIDRIEAARSLAEPAEIGFDAAAAIRRDSDLLSELRAVKGLIEERFGALAFMEKLQRRPAEARLAQKLLDCGFSPMLVRKMADGFNAQAGDESEWAAQVLERNLRTAAAHESIEDRGGVFALIGATGVGKTTTTAKIAAAFAARHGAANLGLITLDAYRVGAHEQLRAYGRILGVPVHTAHDRASLEDLLDLLTAKKMVLIDTAGMAQRDTRTKELLDMLSHRSVQRLLVVNAASQGETIEDVLVAYRASSCTGVILSKLDEAIKLGPALDAAIRHKLTVVGVANGQRVPEDWHRLSSNALVQRAMRGGGSAAWRLDAAEMNLVFATAPGAPGASALNA